MTRTRLNAGYTYSHRVRRGEDGPIARHLATRFGHSTEDEWRARLIEGRVRVSGEPVGPDHPVQAGDLIEYVREPWEEAVPDVELPVLHEDEHVLAVNKPAGLQVLPAGSRLEATAISIVRGGDPERAEWSPVHRLGRGTSGILLFGKTARARATLSEQFRERRAAKLYLAWVQGTALPTSLRVRERIGPVEHSRGRVHGASPAGRPALTLVRVLTRDDARSMSLVAAIPITGRPDQIRIHLACAGAPIVGDRLFGVGATLMNARPGDPGYLLHAAGLRFRHPATGHWARLRCRPPWTPAELDGARFLDLLRDRGLA